MNRPSEEDGEEIIISNSETEDNNDGDFLMESDENSESESENENYEEQDDDSNENVDQSFVSKDGIVWNSKPIQPQTFEWKPLFFCIH